MASVGVEECVEDHMISSGHFFNQFYFATLLPLFLSLSFCLLPLFLLLTPPLLSSLSLTFSFSPLLQLLALAPQQ